MLITWLKTDLGLQVQSIEPASSDASFRRYFRVLHAKGCHIVMDAPPDKENTQAFISNAALFRQAQLHVPMIFQQNLEQGFLMLEDLGCKSYLDALNLETVDELYAKAMDSIYKLQTRVSIDRCNLPAYDRSLLIREINIFEEWFLEKFLGLSLPVSVKQSLNQLLIDSALDQPLVCVHRDFHSRNLMLLDVDSPGVIDFQDAVVGPVTYDLVSLLRDCYIDWSDLQVYSWMSIYYQRLLQSGMIKVELEQFKRWFDLMGMQRHLKAVGIFARLHLRDTKSTYLADIPRTFRYIHTICQIYPELNPFKNFLQQQVMPVYQVR